jgi:hypothetical protein
MSGGPVMTGNAACFSVGVAAELPVVRRPGVGCFDDPAQPESQRLLLDARDLGTPELDLVLVDARLSESCAHGLRVVATVEMQRADVDEQADRSIASRVGSSMRTSLRVAPSVAQPIGMPRRSEATDHFQPDFPRSVAFGPVPSPP